VRHTQKFYMAEMIEHEVGDDVLVRYSQRSMPVPSKITGVYGDIDSDGDNGELSVKANDGQRGNTTASFLALNFHVVPLKPSMPVIYSNNNRSTYATIIAYDDSTKKI